jgi:UDP-GlcNAc:undecaprenyl-phosphate GlcNAc-1-phosphate transferase
MIASGAAFLIAMAVAAFSTPLIRDAARARGWLDRADGVRKIHHKATPRLGGIAIALGFYVPLVALFFVPSHLGALLFRTGNHMVALACGGAVIVALGIYDDLRGANAYTKFGVQFLVGGMLYAYGFRVESLATPLGTFELGALSAPLTVLWIVGVTNAMNLIDGLDGLAGGVALIALIVVFAIAGIRSQPLMMFFAAALAGSVLGFLFYNFNPATIFMGDSGSMFLGFMLATSTIKASQKASTAVAILIPIVLLAIPIIDTLLALTRRASRGQQLFTGDREHVHHRLMALGLTQRQAVMVLYFACVVCAGCSLALFVADGHAVGTLVLGLLAITLAVAVYRIWRPAASSAAQVVNEPVLSDVIELADQPVRVLRKRARSSTRQSDRKDDRFTTRS